MSIDVTSYINSTYTADTETTASSELGQDAFLELLITQLQYQDPLDPMDDTDMVSQLASFSSLESMENIESLVEGLSDTLSDQSLLNASTYLGKEIEASGSSIGKTDDGVSTVTYTLAADAEDVWAYVVNEDGDILASENLGARDAGDYSYVWDGLDDNGDEVDDGSYAVAFTAEDADGDSVYVSTQVSGTVVQVYTQDGDTYLGLDDDRLVNLLNVTRIVDSSAVASSDDDDS